MKSIAVALVFLGSVSSVPRAMATDIEYARVGEAVARRDCMFCHGSGAQGFSTAPRLAGQRADYIVNAIASFRRHVRDNPRSRDYMWVAAQRLTQGTARAVAMYLSKLDARPAADGRSGNPERAAAIYRDGIPEANVPACIVCHGPKAEGAGAIPRLGGLSARYLRDRLVQWTQGYHAKAAPMPDIARKLSADDIEIMASYLSYLK
jgi:cytochrome c553